jgi:hypothetical protein
MSADTQVARSGTARVLHGRAQRDRGSFAVAQALLEAGAMRSFRPALLLLLLCACESRVEPSAGDGGDAGTPVSNPDAAFSCTAGYHASAPVRGDGVRFAEVLSSNDGANVDELGETDDWLELENASDRTIDVSRYVITDASGKPRALPQQQLAPHERLLLWADDEPEQGPRHLDFKLSAAGEHLTLWADPCTPVDRVVVPALPTNESYARFASSFASCRYPTPGRDNGASCAAPEPPALPEEVKFAAFTWPATFPSAPSPLALTELALRPARFIEVLNTSAQSVALSDYALQLSPLREGAPYPDRTQPVAIAWPQASLAPGQRALVALTPADTATLETSSAFEGVVSLFGPSGVIDRADFAGFPAGTVLARAEPSSSFRFCSNATPGADGVCEPLASRALGDHLTALQTESDFAGLAAGATELGLAPVKFVVDMEGGDTVKLLSSARWALHYTYVRERIDLAPPLDRCDAVQAAQFDQGWWEFSVREYFRTVGRRYLLGTLIEHANGLHTVEFASGDTIDAPLMRRAFLAVIARTPRPREWSIRPIDAAQVAELRKLEGTLPIVGPSAPFSGLSYQPLTRAEGFGTLRFVAAHDLPTATLDPHTILVTDDVPNDVPFVGGLITEAFQTPLAHVNVLSQSRGTPNMALRAARTNARLAPLLGKLVRLEVGPADFTVREASVEEADAYWQLQRPSGPRLVAPSDVTVRHVLPLAGQTLAALPVVGAKAAQFAELYRVTQPDERCGGPVPFAVPAAAFALPVAHYLDHFRTSGAEARLNMHMLDPAFRVDIGVRSRALAEVRDAMLQHPVEASFLAEVEAAVSARFGNKRVRFRSSSNTEDLPTFNGAGLHTSASAELDDPERKVADALRTVWSSLWNTRAYDERESANLEQSAALMGVLVHEAYGGEAAQGVAISRNLLDLTRDDAYYVNTQIGEASVVNPAPGVVTEELLYFWPQPDARLSYQTRSSLNGGAPILSLPEVAQLACGLGAIQQHFRPLLDPQRSNRLFAMQVEFKFERSRALVIKQARLQPFGRYTPPRDCR